MTNGQSLKWSYEGHYESEKAKLSLLKLPHMNLSIYLSQNAGSPVRTQEFI